MNKGNRLTRILVIVMILSTMMSNVVFGSTPSGWAIEGIKALQEESILRDDMFSDYQNTITRLDYAYLVYKLIESYGISLSEIAYIDKDYTLIDCNDYYVIGLFKAEVITGYLDHTYKPNQPITRQEICTLYMKALEVIGVQLSGDSAILNNFTDENSIGSWARTSMVKCLNYGIINGISNDQLAPLGFSTIEQSLVIFNRIISNADINSHVESKSYTLYPKVLSYNKSDQLGYYVNKDLAGNISSVKLYDDFSLINEVTINKLGEEVQAMGENLYFIDTDNSLTQYNIETGQSFVLDERTCNSFVVTEEMVYSLILGQLYCYNLTQGTVGEAENLIVGDNYIEIKAYIDEIGTYLLLLDEQENLYLYDDNSASIIASGVQSFDAYDDVLYYMYSDQSLRKRSILGGESVIIAENVHNFALNGHNVLYINQGGALYNINRGIQGNLIYQGDLLGLMLDFNYLEVTEIMVGDNVFNHLITLFYIKEYFGY
jgi:hypothetical protein